MSAPDPLVANIAEAIIEASAGSQQNELALRNGGPETGKARRKIKPTTFSSILVSIVTLLILLWHFVINSPLLTGDAEPRQQLHIHIHRHKLSRKFNWTIPPPH